MNLKVADFGFAVNKNVAKLKKFRGTKSYMAPEIQKGERYDGKSADIFSMGVVIFILVVGYMPFSEATENDKYFYMLQNGKKDEDGIVNEYWSQYRCPHLSLKFKQLIQQILN